ncbi:MAG: type 1 glutamine amidotransferase domain-containing protein [Gammaproteobacteria bacterium]
MARIAIPLADGVEDSEFAVPRARLHAAGHAVTVVGSTAGATVTGKNAEVEQRIDAAAGDLDPTGFDALVIPGGTAPDHLRMDPAMVDFVRRFCLTGRPLAAICHGPQLLIEAGQVAGRRLTSWPSVSTDLLNAGATWEDAEVVIDGNFLTSRRPADLPAFCDALLRRLE